MDRMDERLRPLINQVLEKHGMSSFDELKDRLMQTLSDEDKQVYQDVSSIPCRGDQWTWYIP